MNVHKTPVEYFEYTVAPKAYERSIVPGTGKVFKPNIVSVSQLPV